MLIVEVTKIIMLSVISMDFFFYRRNFHDVTSCVGIYESWGSLIASKEKGFEEHYVLSEPKFIQKVERKNCIFLSILILFDSSLCFFFHILFSLPSHLVGRKSKSIFATFQNLKREIRNYGMYICLL